MIFDEMNKYAEDILKGKSGYEDLRRVCLPYCLFLRKKLGFQRIPIKEVDDLTSAAISRAFEKRLKDGKLFAVSLHNCFRDACRVRERIIREQTFVDIAEKCNMRKYDRGIGVRQRHPSPDTDIENRDSVERAMTILENHDRFSRQVVCQKTRGSTYPDMADIFSSTINECKRVYWHDMNHLREKMNPATAGKSGRIEK